MTLVRDPAMRATAARRTARPGGAAPGRGARRRAETRARLLGAARVLMGEKGIDATSIQEITDTADVGFGSFFNHFASKEAIAEAVMDDAIEAFGTAGDRMAAALTDPAEVVAASIRHALARAREDRAWGGFLVRTALAVTGGMRRGLGRRLARDVQAGIDAGRFVVADARAATLAAGGAVLACLAGYLNGELKGDAPVRTAAVTLQILGLSPTEAARIARRSLPPLDDAASHPARRPQQKESR